MYRATFLRGMAMDRDNLNKIYDLRHRLHSCPELSGMETETGRTLRRFIGENTSLEIMEEDGWFYAVKRGTDPTAGSIAFRADMDALPMDEGIELSYASQNAGVSHKCGHDGHSAALCGLALELERIDTKSTVYLLFQKAEETGEGGRCLAELLREKGIEEIYAFHNLSGYPENSVVYRRGLTQPASLGLEIRFIGEPSHAASPEDGCNPAGAIAKTVLFTEQLLKEPHNGMALCTITGIQAGTGDFGISAGDGTLRMTIRAENEDEMTSMTEKILTFAGERAREEGLVIEHNISDYFPETRNSDHGIDRVLRAAERLDLQTVEMDHLWRASEDFGHCLKVCSGAMFYIGIGENHPALHTTEYDFNDRILETSVNMFTELIKERENDHRD